MQNIIPSPEFTLSEVFALCADFMTDAAADNGVVPEVADVIESFADAHGQEIAGFELALLEARLANVRVALMIEGVA